MADSVLSRHQFVLLFLWPRPGAVPERREDGDSGPLRDALAADCVAWQVGKGTGQDLSGDQVSSKEKDIALSKEACTFIKDSTSSKL